MIFSLLPPSLNIFFGVDLCFDCLLLFFFELDLFSGELIVFSFFSHCEFELSISLACDSLICSVLSTKGVILSCSSLMNVSLLFNLGDKGRERARGVGGEVISSSKVKPFLVGCLKIL